jgi:hypothetical protein
MLAERLTEARFEQGKVENEGAYYSQAAGHECQPEEYDEEYDKA